MCGYSTGFLTISKAFCSESHSPCRERCRGRTRPNGILSLMIAELALAAATLSIPQLSAAPAMAAPLGDTWKGAAVFHLEHEGTYRKPAPEDTSVHIGIFGDSIYVAFEAEQHEPLEATQLTDGPGVLTADAVMVHLWPDGLSGYAYWFATNMHGARDQYSSENAAYAPQWSAFGKQTANGYVSILKIPLSAMHVQKGGQWRAQFHRIVAATNSNYVWELDPEQTAFIDGRYGGHISGIQDTDTHVASRPQPRVQLYGLGEFASANAGSYTSRVGADFSAPITATTSAFGTVHPDFSNVEIDQQSIAPTEFARRFSEVRPFFTQASANFNRAQGLSMPMSTLYTPAIPTFRNGFGVSGRQGDFSFGSFDASGYGRSDDALSLNASDSKQRFALNLQQVQVNDSTLAFRDLVESEGISYTNPHSHLTFAANNASDTGSAVTDPAAARYQDIGAWYMTNTDMLGIAVQRMGPQFNPADGYANQPPGQPGIAGYTAMASRQINYTSKSRILDIAFGMNVDRYHGPNGAVNQSDFGDSFRVDFKNLVSVTAMQGISALQTGSEFLPYNSSGLMLGYAQSTSHPSQIMYMTGKYYHGTLSSWSRSTTISFTNKVSLLFEADDTMYASAVAAEPDAKQWLERASVNYQVNHNVSLDFGARKIVGFNQPFAFMPMTSFVNATNLSAAIHYFRGNNELYIVYGDPNRLSTVPALFVKLIRYVGAGKGT